MTDTTAAPECGCRRCIRERDPMVLMTRMIVCPACGNKRCPRAADHAMRCTASNAPGQVGTPAQG